MITLSDGRQKLYQWDTGVKVTVDSNTIGQVHFSNKAYGRSFDVDVVNNEAVIPPELLQSDKPISIWAFVQTDDGGYTKDGKVFEVETRNRPNDYVYTPMEQIKLQGAIDTANEAKKIAASNVPYIGANGNWWVNGVDTGVNASGGGTQRETWDLLYDIVTDGNVARFEFTDLNLKKAKIFTVCQKADTKHTLIGRIGYSSINDLAYCTFSPEVMHPDYIIHKRIDIETEPFANITGTSGIAGSAARVLYSYPNSKYPYYEYLGNITTMQFFVKDNYNFPAGSIIKIYGVNVQ